MQRVPRVAARLRRWRSGTSGAPRARYVGSLGRCLIPASRASDKGAVVKKAEAAAKDADDKDAESAKYYVKVRPQRAASARPPPLPPRGRLPSLLPSTRRPASLPCGCDGAAASRRSIQAQHPAAASSRSIQPQHPGCRGEPLRAARPLVPTRP